MLPRAVIPRPFARQEVRMIRTLRALVLPLALVAALPALANHHEANKEDAKPAAAPEMTAEQKAMMEAYTKAGAPGAQHAAMAKMAGTYDLEVTSWDAPGAPPRKSGGTATRSMALDGRVMVESLQSDMNGQPFTGHGMQGYDNVSGRYWGTWNDSMSTGVMVSDGECDDQGACKFTGSWNDPVTKGKVNARMTTRWTDANTEVFEMFGPGPDGKEFKMMEITYKKRP
jgi:hypothetical protein